MTSAHSDLLARTAELVDVASVSQDEGALADLVEESLSSHGHLEVVRVEHNLIARTALGHRQRVILAGHLDTVPPAGNAAARLEQDVLYGCGAADMKGGLAVLLELAGVLKEPRVDTTFVFYACEEIARRFSGLYAIERARPELLQADAAVLLEPTSARVEAGCQGVLRAVVELGGVRAHSARPWTGRNAIHRLQQLLERVASFSERRPVIEGCEYHESLQAVAVQGGGAGNVVPDRVELVLSHRFAPDRDAEEAFRQLSDFLAPVLEVSAGDSVVLDESAPGALPSLGQPFLADLVRRSGIAPLAKVAWTDVAFFAERQIPAANYGPGDPVLAHRADEHLTRRPLEEVYEVLSELLSDGTGS